ncbi:MAG TPA: hypothetical protein VEW48_11615 [Thermoanaerobaculia bacterium]|nr:hypothetical protein [Thermoanaerobaculia bacterium]
MRNKAHRQSIWGFPSLSWIAPQVKVVPFLLILLACVTGCVVNKAISASAVADNLAVEKAQNEMLLLNVLRAKDHLPMYVTSISNITGSIKAEASLNATVPFGSGAPAVHYTASPSATYYWNPTFDVTVWDTSEFMHGFLTPVSSDIFAYYWNLGFYPKVLFHLMVLRVQITVKHEVCDTKLDDRLVDEYIFQNNHERGNTFPKEIKRFAEWVDYFLEQNPHLVEGKIESLVPTLTREAAQGALVQGWKEGLTLIKLGEDEYQFQRLAASPAILKLDRGGDGDALQKIYDWVSMPPMPPSSGEGREEYQHHEPYSSERDAEGCPEKATKSSDSVPQAKASAGQFRESGLIQAKDGRARMTITLYLRSPEAILYYLGEVARLEEDQGKAPSICIGGRLGPLFVARRKGECARSLVSVATGEGSAYSIPAQENSINMEEDEANDSKCFPKFDLLPLSCDPGRSMEVLTIVSQLIALQKSGKNLPTTSVVRVVGQ